MAQNPVTIATSAMRKRRLTQGATAALLGISQASLSRILNNLQNPTEETQESFFRELGVPRSAWPVRLDGRTEAALDRAEKIAKKPRPRKTKAAA